MYVCTYERACERMFICVHKCIYARMHAFMYVNLLSKFQLSHTKNFESFLRSKNKKAIFINHAYTMCICIRVHTYICIRVRIHTSHFIMFIHTVCACTRIHTSHLAKRTATAISELWTELFPTRSTNRVCSYCVV